MFTRRYTNFWDGLFRPSRTHLLGSGEVKTLTNLVTNGDFSNGTTGWTLGNCTATAANNELSVTATARYGGPFQSITNPTSYRSHVIYCGGLFKLSPSNIYEVYMIVNDGVNQTIVYPSVLNEYHRISTLHTMAANASTLYIKLQDGRLSGWSLSNAMYWIMVDLTASFGAGNEPTKTDMDNWIATQSNSWFATTAEYLANTNQWF
jgi:hypothetical protein